MFTFSDCIVRRLLESMFQITKPEGTILLSFLASNPIFTMYQRMAERKEWAKYMTVHSNLLQSVSFSSVNIHLE